jgi:hypothetical protein
MEILVKVGKFSMDGGAKIIMTPGHIIVKNRGFRGEDVLIKWTG